MTNTPLTDRENQMVYEVRIDRIKPVEAKQDGIYWAGQDARKAAERKNGLRYNALLDSRKYK